MYMGCRNDEGARAALQSLVTMGCAADRLIELPLDLSNFDSVNRFAAEIHKSIVFKLSYFYLGDTNLLSS